MPFGRVPRSVELERLHDRRSQVDHIVEVRVSGLDHDRDGVAGGKVEHVETNLPVRGDRPFPVLVGMIRDEPEPARGPARAGVIPIVGKLDVHPAPRGPAERHLSGCRGVERRMGR